MAKLGNRDPLTVFNGDPKSERDILKHAITFLYKKQSREYVTKIFAVGMTATDRKYAESIMESSGHFDFDSSTGFRPYGLSSESFKKVHTVGVDSFVDGLFPSEEVLLPALNPIIQPNPTAKSQITIKTIARFTNTISKHPLWSAIIAGLILLAISHFVFGSP